MIISEQESGYLVPSHFAIIRVDRRKAVPEYILWTLKKDSTKKKIQGIVDTVDMANSKLRLVAVTESKSKKKVYIRLKFI